MQNKDQNSASVVSSAPIPYNRMAALQEEDRILHVGNLDDRVTEEFIGALFSQIASVTGIRLIAGTTARPYALVQFADHNSAAYALQLMDKRILFEKVMEVKWIPKPPTLEKKVNTSQHFHVFVGDLSPDVVNEDLKQAFAKFGEISAAKVISDQHTLKSKGFGFVSFPRRAEAERAIEQMNGQWLGKRTIRTNWATRKADFGELSDENRSETTNSGQTYEQILSQAGPENSTVFVGNVNQIATDEDVLKEFNRFGEIVEIRRFKTHGNAFLKFGSKEKAARAIHEMNGNDFMGQMLRCSWGKSEGSRNGLHAQGQGGSQHRADSQYMWPQYNYNYPQKY
jgi:nucleolysin TIA-1/TIAR